MVGGEGGGGVVLADGTIEKRGALAMFGTSGSLDPHSNERFSVLTHQQAYVDVMASGEGGARRNSLAIFGSKSTEGARGGSGSVDPEKEAEREAAVRFLNMGPLPKRPRGWVEPEPERPPPPDDSGSGGGGGGRRANRRLWGKRKVFAAAVHIGQSILFPAEKAGTTLYKWARSQGSRKIKVAPLDPSRKTPGPTVVRAPLGGRVCASACVGKPADGGGPECTGGQGALRGLSNGMARAAAQIDGVAVARPVLPPPRDPPPLAQATTHEVLLSIWNRKGWKIDSDAMVPQPSHPL